MARQMSSSRGASTPMLGIFVVALWHGADAFTLGSPRMPEHEHPHHAHHRRVPLTTTAAPLNGYVHDSSARALVVTMTTPTDGLPIDQVFAHQVRMLVSPRTTIADVVILNNHPAKWFDGASPQEEALSKLDGAVLDGASAPTRVVNVDYGLLEDEAYLHRFFKVLDLPQAYANVSVNTLLAEQANSFKFHKVTPRMLTSNFMGMLHYIDLCLRADDSINVCIFLDSDIFLWRNTSSGNGLADLAVTTFKEHASLISLMPPGVCNIKRIHPSPVLNHGEGGYCGTTRWQSYEMALQSSRHLILNKQNLATHLPVAVEWKKFLQMFEDAWTSAIIGQVPPVEGKMHCMDTFAIHPTTMRPFGLTLPEHLEVMGKAAGLLAGKHGGKKNADGSLAQWVVDGARILIERIEAGNFTTEDQGNQGCVQMKTHPGRVLNGLAWHQEHVGGDDKLTSLEQANLFDSDWLIDQAMPV